MGKAALLAISGFIVVGAVYSFGTDRSTYATNERIADFQYETLARNVAKVGHNRAEKKLAEQVHGGSYGPVNIDNATYDGIPYTVTANWNSVGDKVSVESRATAREGEDDELTYWMYSTYKKENVVSGEISDQAPKWMQYAILAEDLIDLKGNVDVETTDDSLTAEGDEANKLNANIHSNYGIEVSGNAASVRGNGTTDGYVSAKEGVFDPYDCDDCNGVDQNASEVTIPDFDVAGHVSTWGGADETSSDSDGIVEVTGDDDLPDLGDNDRQDPFIWHVDGKLEITGNVTIPGYVLIIAEDGFKITGNVTVGVVDYDASIESNFGIYTDGTGEIDQSGNSELYGQIFAGGGIDIDVGGNADIYGSITTGGDVTMHGTPTLHYRPASPGLTQAWQDLEPQIRLTEHHEGQDAP